MPPSWGGKSAASIVMPLVKLVQLPSTPHRCEARDSPCTGLNSGRDLGSRAEAPGARANGEMPSMHPVA